MSLSELMIDIPAEHERNVFGQFDAYAKKLERTFHVTLIAREGKVKILGEDKNADVFSLIFNLYFIDSRYLEQEENVFNPLIWHALLKKSVS